MPESHAIIQRRYREHNKGNHAECKPENCSKAMELLRKEHDQKLADSKNVRVPIGEYEFGPRGAKLYKDMAIYGNLPPHMQALVVEMCLTVDRLHKLDLALKGRSQWLYPNVKPGGDGEVYTIVVDGALIEARQQAIAFKGMLSEFRMFMATQPSAQVPPVAVSANKGIAGIRDDLLSRREQAAS